MLDRNKICRYDPSQRVTECKEQCSGDSHESDRVAACRDGCGFWDSDVPPTPPPTTSFCDQAGWKEIWSDDFTTFDDSHWTKTIGISSGHTRDAVGTEDNVYIEDGKLVLRSQKQDKDSAHYTTGAVDSKSKKYWGGDKKKTRVCVSSILPGGQGSKGYGIWPAIWMDPEGKKDSEIDILEEIKGDGEARQTYHWEVTKHQDQASHQMPDDWDTTMHEYAVEYSYKGISFAVDGKVTHTVASKAEFHDEPYYMILNTAVCDPKSSKSCWGEKVSKDTVFPTYHKIDYVKVAQEVTMDGGDMISV